MAVGHGSRDPRATATVAALLDRVRQVVPGVDVRAAFLELSSPLLGDVLRLLGADGHRAAVVVPLLLGSAYHARVDIPGVLADFHASHPDVAVAEAAVLAPDERLETVALRRLAEAGVPSDDPETGVVLGAAGSSQQQANDAVAEVAAQWQRRGGWAGVRAAFASADPDVPTAVAELRAAGASRIAVASWFLAPGRLPDAVIEATRRLAPDAPIAEPLGAAPEVAAVVADRYAAAGT